MKMIGILLKTQSFTNFIKFVGGGACCYNHTFRHTFKETTCPFKPCNKLPKPAVPYML